MQNIFWAKLEQPAGSTVGFATETPHVDHNEYISVYYVELGYVRGMSRTEADIEALQRKLQRYKNDVPVVWVQEEPENMGAWPYLKMKFCHKLFDRLRLDAVTRPASASPATGSRAAHVIEQERLLSKAFGGG